MPERPGSLLRHSLLLLILGSTVCAHAVHATRVEPMPGSDARYFLHENSELFHEQIEALRLRDLEHEDTVHQLAPPPEDELPKVDGCLPIHGLRLSGITLLERSARARLSVPQTSCLTHQVINHLIHRLTALYLERGWIAARVLPEVDDGVLTLHVVEGHVERIEGRQAAVNGLFPGLTGRPLNIRDLEQGLHQANRLPSGEMSADIVPGVEPGSSVIVLSEANGVPWHGGLTFDNHGYDSTGRRLGGVNLARDNPSGHYDFLNLSFEHSLAHERFSQRGSLFYSLPYGYWSLRVFSGFSRYLNRQKLQFNTVDLTGQSSQSGVRLDRVLARDQFHIDSGYLALSHKRIQNYFSGSLLQISSPTLTVLELGLDRMKLLAQGAWSIELALEQGMPWLGAQRDWRTPDPEAPRAQFSKLRIASHLRQRVTLWRTPFNLDSRFNAQASRQSLPAVEQLDLAEHGQVRGFRRNSLAGAVGWSWRNTLSSLHQHLGLKIEPHLSLDVGRVLQRQPTRRYPSLIGGGVGLSLSRGPALLDIEYNFPLQKPKEFAPEVRLLLARLSWKY